MSEDPINFRSGLNFYRYAYNHPTRFRDATGLDPVIGTTVGIIAGGLLGLVHQVREHLERANDKAYQGREALHLRDSASAEECTEKMEACK